MKLQNTLPARIQKDLESGIIRKQNLVPFAVVGIVDIVASTELANKLGVIKDWEMKSRFFELARTQADETGMMIVNQTGDGFLIWANHDNYIDWSFELVSFFERLVCGFDAILRSLDIGEVQSGLRMGVAAGPVILGWHESIPSQMMIAGSDVNLAARLCSEAQINELVMSSRVWEVVKHSLDSRSTQRKTYESLKGFAQSVTAVHVNLGIDILKSKHQTVQAITQCCTLQHQMNVDRIMNEAVQELQAA